MLAELIKSTILPSIMQNGIERFWVAYPHWCPDMMISSGMELTYKPIRGKRVAVRNRRAYGSKNIYDARWPEDDLTSSRAPKIYVILSFPTTLQIADYVVHCQPGNILLVPQGIPFASQQKYIPQYQKTLQVVPYKEGVVCWHTQYGQDEKGKSFLQEESCSIPYSQVPLFVDQLVEEAVNPYKYRDIIYESWLKIIFSTLYRELLHAPILQVERGLARIDNRERLRAKHPVQYVEEYVRRNLRKKLTIDDMVRRFYMSRTAFTSQFRARTGKTFNRYIQDLRFETACEFLREGDLGVHHVAAAVGLRPNRLRELFHERLNLSPLEFRRKSRNK